MKGGEEPSKSKRRKTSPNANEDKDYIPITNAAPEGINMDVDDSVMRGIVEQHRQSFMERAFPPIADSPMYMPVDFNKVQLSNRVDQLRN